MAAAAKLFELSELSSGRAAQLAGVSRVEFLPSICPYMVSPLNMTPEKLMRDIENA